MSSTRHHASLRQAKVKRDQRYLATLLQLTDGN